MVKLSIKGSALESQRTTKSRRYVITKTMVPHKQLVVIQTIRNLIKSTCIGKNKNNNMREKNLIKGIEVGKLKNNEGRQQNPNKAKTDPVEDIKTWHNNTRYFINMDVNMAIK